MKTVFHNWAVSTSLVISYLCAPFVHANAQNNLSGVNTDLRFSFLKDSLEFEENSFEFNNLTLSYTGPGSIDVQVTYNTPLFIKVLSTPLPVYSLSSGSQQILPIRFNSIKRMPSDQWHAFTVQVQLLQTGQRIEKKFWIKQKPFTKWKCQLPQPVLTARESDHVVDFTVFIENTGTRPDTYRLFTQGEVEAKIQKKDKAVYLEPGQSTLVNISAILSQNNKQSLRYTDVEIYISNEAGDKRMLVQKINFVGHTYAQEFFRWKKMPLSLELGALNVGSRYSSYAAGLSGNIDLNKNRALLVQLRSNDLFNSSQTHSSTSTVTYMTPEWRIAAGSFVDFNHFLVNGNGVRIKKLIGKEDFVELGYTRGRNEDVRQTSLNFLKSINKNISFANNSFINLDKTTGINSYLSVGSMNWLNGSKTRLRIDGGIGMEEHNALRKPISVNGPMAGYEFESLKSKWTFNSRLTSYSKNFPGLNKGFEYHNHEIKFAPIPFSVAGFYRADRKIFTTPVDSVLRVLFNTDEKEYGIRNGYSRKRFLINTSLSVLQQRQDSANSFIARMNKASLSMNWMLKNDLSFSIFSNAGIIHIPEKPAVGKFAAFRNIGSIQAKNLGVNFIFDKGPYYYYEIKEYAREKLNFQRMQLSPFYQKQFARLNSFVRMQLDYSREQPLDMDFLLATTQFLVTSSKLRMDLALLSSIDLTHNKRTSINFSIRKQLQVPVFKNSNSYSFDLLLFKDKNGNGVFDLNEETIKNANVLANHVLLTTNEVGEIQFRNISQEAIILDMSGITNVRGWIPKQGFIQTITPEKNRKRIVVPFKESRLIIGKLMVMADDKSEQVLSLGGIRITATDNTGNSFQTLTDLQGEFTMSLPAGDYIVSLNDQAFEDPFKPVEVSKLANLTNNKTLELSFEIRQKKRQINIRKSGN